MDCCNYMQYRHHQNYYGSQYYEHLPYHGEFYGQQMYPEYYGNTPYYPQHWQCAPSSFADYVYNPKEARIRKAMREATRDRSIGASPMLPRPSARRPSSHGWVGGHDESLMMPPLAGMRGGLESPVCFPISTGTGSTQFMPPMNGYSKLDSPISSTSNVLHHTNYMQPNPLAQLQQQTEMWHNYQESIRPRSSGNPFMIQDVPQGYPPPQAHDVSNSMLMEKQQQQQARQTHSVNSSISMTPPHSNENVPPDGMIDRVGTPAHVDSNSNGDCENNEVFESKHVIETVQPLMENNNMQSTNTTYMTMYGQNVTPQHQFGKMEDKMKKPVVPQIRKKTSSKPLPDFNEAFGSTERGRFQSPPDPRLAPNKGYPDYFFDSSPLKFDDYQI